MTARAAFRWGAVAAGLVLLGAFAAAVIFSTAPRSAACRGSVCERRWSRGGAQWTAHESDVFELQAGDVITTATNSIAVIAYEHEATRIQMQPGSVVVFGDATAGKQFELRRGIIQARVAPA